jgi:hypothetical protein
VRCGTADRGGFVDGLVVAGAVVVVVLVVDGAGTVVGVVSGTVCVGTLSVVVGVVSVGVVAVAVESVGVVAVAVVSVGVGVVSVGVGVGVVAVVSLGVVAVRSVVVSPVGGGSSRIAAAATPVANNANVDTTTPTLRNQTRVADPCAVMARSQPAAGPFGGSP